MSDTVNVTPAQAIEVLNRALESDPDAMEALFAHRVTCNEALAEDLTIQAQNHAGVYRVGLLGILNGIFGVNQEGAGHIKMVVSGHNRVERFISTGEAWLHPCRAEKAEWMGKHVDILYVKYVGGGGLGGCFYKSDLQVVAEASAEDASNMKLVEGGIRLEWPALDWSIRVSDLHNGITGSPQWMERKKERI